MTDISIDALLANSNLQIGKAKVEGHATEPSFFDLIDVGNLTREKLQELRQLKNKVGLFAISPYEPHGPHLPVAQDVRFAESLMQTMAFLFQRNGIYAFQHQTVPFGASTLYAPIYDAGFWQVYNTIKHILRIFEDGGFTEVVICNGHGGPLHNVAIDLAIKYGKNQLNMNVYSAFATMFEAYETGEVSIPGFPENFAEAETHAGAAEVSIAQLAYPELVAGNPSESHFPELDYDRLLPKAIFAAVSRFLPQTAFQQTMARNSLAWITDREAPDYLGDPSIASAAAGAELIRQFALFAERKVVLPIAENLGVEIEEGFARFIERSISNTDSNREG